MLILGWYVLWMKKKFKKQIFRNKLVRYIRFLFYLYIVVY